MTRALPVASAMLLAFSISFSHSLSSDAAGAGAVSANVATFAGTGVAGNADGPIGSATFSSPAAVAVAPNGDVYVADRSLSTIRLIHGGVVRTIVGMTSGDPTWRPGGYRDGPAAQALVRHPEGLAIAPDGSLVIADTWNACVRRYKNGIVSTIAGAPTRWGDVDGPNATARFKNPMAVAVDANGTIYVSDYQDPIRTIARDGTVASLPFTPTGVVFGLATALPDKLFIADESGLLEMRTAGGTPQLHLIERADLRARETTEGGAPLGRPYALAALDEHTVAYSDMFDDSIHLAGVTYVQRIAGAPSADPNEAGGFRDGAPRDALFNAPAGIAAYRGGWLVADMGNHRIRYVPGVDTRDAVRAGRLDNLSVYLARKRPPVVLVGDSEIWTDTSYDESIAGRLQQLRPENDVVPISLPGLDDPGITGNFLANYLEIDGTYTVVYLFDDAGVTDHSKTPYATLETDDAWTKKLADQFAALRTACGAARLIVADIPLGLEASPTESSVIQELFVSDSSEWEHINAVHASVAATARKSGVTYADLWPAFRDAEIAGHGPLYHQLDIHLTANGRARLATMIAGLLAK